MTIMVSAASANLFPSILVVPTGDCDDGVCDFPLECTGSTCYSCLPNPPGIDPSYPHDSICTTRNYWREIYIGSPTCMVTVYFSKRKCLIYCGYTGCRIGIDSILINTQVNGCLTCTMPNSAAAMKIMLRTIEKELVKIQAFGSPCGPNPPLPNSKYRYVVGKAVCWKRTNTYGVGELSGQILHAIYEPCRSDVCCLSKYCVTTDENAIDKVTLCDTKICPTTITNCQEDINGNPIEGCDNSTWFVCD